MENLPEYVIATNILSRLPTESILCAKQVCRTWNKSIKIDSWFRKTHLCSSLHNHDYYVDSDDNYSRCNKKQRLNNGSNHAANVDSIPTSTTSMVSLPFLFLAKTYGISPKKTTYYGEYHYDDNDDKFFFKTFTGGYNFTNVSSCLSKNLTTALPRKTTQTLVGSCNGLVCFAISEISTLVGGDPVYICNPVTREEWYLPRYNIIDCTYNYEPIWITSGFCYVPSTNEYKVVRICYHPLEVYSENIGDLQVYTLGVDSTWRHKEFISFKLTNTAKSPPMTPGVVADGAIHWLDYLSWRIVAFDFEDEVVLEVPTPPCFKYEEPDDYLELIALGGCLCVVHHMPGRSVDIWSLKKMNICSCRILKECKKNCRDWNWIKEFSIAMDVKEEQYLSVPFALTKTGKILLWYNRSILSVYDPKTAVLKKLADGDFGTFVYQAIPHVNSFVSVQVPGNNS